MGMWRIAECDGFIRPNVGPINMNSAWVFGRKRHGDRRKPRAAHPELAGRKRGGGGAAYRCHVVHCAGFVRGNGSSRDIASARKAIGKLQGGSRRRPAAPHQANFGVPEEMLDCATRGCSLGGLRFHFVQYEGKIMANYTTRILLGSAIHGGSNQPDAISLGSGAESIARNKPARPPHGGIAGFVAKRIRESHASLDLDAHAEVAKQAAKVESEVRSAPHMAFSMKRCPDLRTSRLFLTPALWCCARIAVMVFDSGDTSEAPPHAFELGGGSKFDGPPAHTHTPTPQTVNI